TPGDRVVNRGEGLGLHQGWRAAAEKNCRYYAPGYARRRTGNLGAKGANPARLVDLFAADVTIEVAIGTFRQAKWPMDIDPECRSSIGPADPYRGNGFVSAAQDKPRQVLRTHGRDAIGLCRAAAVRVSPRSTFRRKCVAGRRAKTSDHNRSRGRRAAAIPACRRRALRIVPWAHPARTGTVRRQNARGNVLPSPRRAAAIRARSLPWRGESRGPGRPSAPSECRARRRAPRQQVLNHRQARAASLHSQPLPP